MVEVPDGSIYFWMFSQGLKHVPLERVLSALQLHGKDIRDKDVQNYWNGWYRSALYSGRPSILKFGQVYVPSSKTYFEKSYEDYDDHPFLGQPEIDKRYVPCSAGNKPLIKWSEGCLSLHDAQVYPNAKYIGENLKGCKFIVIDCDGDHDDELDMETIEFLWQFTGVTHTLMKPKAITAYDGYEDDRLHANMPASFHLTFRVDKVIPTMHFNRSHVDIVGNEKNSLRYFKDKVHNGKEPMDMTSDVWERIKSYIRKREEG